MKGIAFAFFATAAVCVTLGMVWGLQMSISTDHTFGPAHAHLNLVGWATMALYGVCYHLVPGAAAGALPKIHYACATGGVVTMAPGIAVAIAGGPEALAAIGSLLTLAAMLIFLFTVLTRRGAVAA